MEQLRYAIKEGTECEGASFHLYFPVLTLNDCCSFLPKLCFLSIKAALSGRFREGTGESDMVTEL